jgi:hypothetical protein
MSKSDDKDEFEDPSLQKAQDFEKFSSDPPKLPGTEVLTLEPKLMALAIKVIEGLLNPQLTDNIIENLNKTIELNLENKKNKLNYLKNDTNYKNKNNETIIKSIHSDGKQQPIEIITEKKDNNEDKKKEDKKEDKKEEDKKEEKKENQEGGSYPFFTEQECSFF